jgi:hypothetical protein
MDVVLALGLSFRSYNKPNSNNFQRPVLALKHRTNLFLRSMVAA